jgi:predicted MFS family arabinose efflux permease
MSGGDGITRGIAVAMFASFALAYFFSALVRGVTATLAPEFSAELGLGAADLGLLAGAYFAGFALMQLPMGSGLDRIGPRRVLLALLGLAVLGCAAFAVARGFAALTLARALVGVGVSACLMAPMTAFRRRFDIRTQLRANAWMLMSGSLGMVAATLPVQWLLPLIGWRGLFWVVAASFAVAMLAIAVLVPRDPPSVTRAAGADGGYLAVLRSPVFATYAPLAFFVYGGMIAVQALWAGPWLVQVAGQSPEAAAQGLFLLNVAMLATFFAWGFASPRLHGRGWDSPRLIAVGVPVSLAIGAWSVARGAEAGAGHWALYCTTSTVASLSMQRVGESYPAALAGRALSAYNLVIFAGVFAAQWGIGAAVDAFSAAGWSTLSAYRGAFALWGCCCAASALWFAIRRAR